MKLKKGYIWFSEADNEIVETGYPDGTHQAAMARALVKAIFGHCGVVYLGEL